MLKISGMKKITCVAVLTLVLISLVSCGANSDAQNDLQNKKAALDIIFEYSSKICGEIPVTTTNTEVSGKVKTESTALINKLSPLGLGLEGEAEIKKFIYFHLPSEDFSPSLNKSMDCKVGLSSELQKRFLEDLENQRIERENKRIAQNEEAKSTLGTFFAFIVVIFIFAIFIVMLLL